MAAPKAIAIELLEAEAAELASRRRKRKVARTDALRAEIVLLAAEGDSNLAIADRLDPRDVRDLAAAVRSESSRRPAR